MNKLNRLATLALPVLLLSQGLAIAAATDSTAIAECTAAIADYFEERQAAPIEIQIDTSAMGPNRRLAEIAVFELDAHDPDTNNLVGRFSCTVNGQARVRRLQELPLTAPDAVARVRD